VEGPEPQRPCGSSTELQVGDLHFCRCSSSDHERVDSVVAPSSGPFIFAEGLLTDQQSERCLFVLFMVQQPFPYCSWLCVLALSTLHVHPRNKP